MSAPSTLVYAIHRLSLGAEPGEPKIATGRFDANGSPIFKYPSRKVPPGLLFDLPEGKTRNYLFEQGAVRAPTEQELAMWERLYD